MSGGYIFLILWELRVENTLPHSTGKPLATPCGIRGLFWLQLHHPVLLSLNSLATGLAAHWRKDEVCAVGTEGTLRECMINE